MSELPHNPSDGELFDAYSQTRNNWEDDNTNKPHPRLDAENAGEVTRELGKVLEGLGVHEVNLTELAGIIGEVHGMNSGDNTQKLFDNEQNQATNTESDSN